MKSINGYNLRALSIRRDALPSFVSHPTISVIKGSFLFQSFSLYLKILYSSNFAIFPFITHGSFFF